MKGTQPSATITLKPFCRAAIAAASPAGPPPTTNTSVLSCDATTRPPFVDCSCWGAFAADDFIPANPAHVSIAGHFTHTNRLHDLCHFASLDVDGPAGHAERFRPGCRRRFCQLHYLANCWHRRAARVHLVLQRLNHVWMVVPDIVHAVAGQKIQNAAAVFSEQLAAKASFILH